MIDGLKPYPAMKDSGVPSLGRIPEHWETLPLKRWVKMNRAVLAESTPPEYEFRYLDIGSVGTGVLTAKPQRLRFATAPSRARRVVRDGDTIVSTVRTYLKAVYFVDRDADDLVCSTGFAVLTPLAKGAPGFVSYLCQSAAFTDRVTADSVGIAYPAIAETRLGVFHVAVPSLSEQAAIVRFLDHADRRIRRYIRAKQKLIKLLEEQKQAIIHRAVTRGLDPNVRLKPSGVEWLGHVPQHWEVTPLTRVLMQRKEKNDPIRTSNILSLSLRAGVIPYAEKEAGGNKAKEDLSDYMLAYPGDIVVNSMNVVVGSVGLSKYFGAVSPVYYMLRPRDTVDEVEYFSAVFRDVGFQRSLFGLGNGIMYIESKSSGKLNTIRLRIPMTRLKRVLLPRPPSAEQAAIVGHLDEITADVAATLSRTERQIDLLHEYRTRLIADVVTGKLDVRAAAARLPQEAENLELLDETGVEVESEAEEADACDVHDEPEEAET